MYRHDMFQAIYRNFIWKINNFRNGYVPEKIQPIPKGVDLEMLVESILSMDVDEILRKEKELIGDQPNTYMFTK